MHRSDLVHKGWTRISVCVFSRMFRLIYSVRSAVLGTMYLAFGIVCTQLPLFRTFGYEFAVLAGLCVGLTAGPFAIASFRLQPSPVGGQDTTASPFRAHMAGIVRVAASVWILLLLPMSILIANAWFVPNCTPLEGAAFFVLIPGLTALFGTALAALCTRLFRSWRAYAAYTAVIAALLLHPVAQIYSQPQLYAYNHLFGLFVGFSWDEARPPLGTLLLYRVLTCAYCVALIQVSFVLTERGREYLRGTFRAGFFLAFVVSAGVIGAGFAASDHLGFSNSAAYARAQLGAVFQTRHCTIVYDSTRVPREEIARIADEHEFQLQRVVSTLSVKRAVHITTYLYPDAASKRRLIGTESSQIARPWTRELHLSLAGWSDALTHELVHAVAASFGPKPFGAPVFRCLGLTEGLAVAVEWAREGRTPHEQAAGMLAQDLLPSARACMTTQGFLSGASSAGYIASGSFTHWLLETRGFDVVKRAYSDDNVEAAVGRSFEQLDEEWRAYLRKVPRVLPDSEAIRYAFLRPPLARKICPRAVTEANRRAREAFRAGDFVAADSLYRASEALAPSATAVFGRTLSLLNLERHEEVLEWTGTLLADPSRAHTIFPVRIWRAFAAWYTGDSARADEEVTRVVRASLGGWAAEDARRFRAALRRSVSREAIINTLARARRPQRNETYARRSDSLDLTRALSVDPGNNLARLLYAERCADRHGETAARSLLEDAQPGEFQIDCLRLAAMLYHEAGEYEREAVLLQTLSEADVSLADRELNGVVIARYFWKLAEQRARHPRPRK
ncbi:MAG: hypothetical protein HY962_02015 [Ignavibacteriae bacterium]|nr:hypothetical protein [Ignavibacteriota bacterium]